MLPKLGEIEGSLWHFRAELSEWKKKINAMLGRINGSLGLFLDLSQDSKFFEGGKRIGPATINIVAGLGVRLFGGPNLLKRLWWFIIQFAW